VHLESLWISSVEGEPEVSGDSSERVFPMPGSLYLHPPLSLDLGCLSASSSEAQSRKRGFHPAVCGLGFTSWERDGREYPFLQCHVHHRGW
jgi:hypothetical protein